MDCFPTQREYSDDDYDYSDVRVKTWTPEAIRKDLKPDQYVKDLCCQAYVQILFAEKGKWVPDSIGELMIYKINSINDDKEMYLSFFSGPRQRFQIKISDIKKITKPHPNLIVIVHGKTVMGLNFAIEHKHRVDVFVRQIKPNLPVTILAVKIRRAAENISDEMKKTANKIKSSLSIEPPEEKQGTNKINFRETKEQTPERLAKRRSSDPVSYMKVQPVNEYFCPPQSDDENVNNKSILKSPPILKTTRGKQYNTISSGKRVRFDSTVQKSIIPRSQSLRRRNETDKSRTIEYSKRKAHVKEMIILWDSKK